MRPVLYILSIVLQLFYIFAIWTLIAGIFDFYSLLQDAMQTKSGDPKLIAGIISEAITLSLLRVLFAVIGLVISWFILRSGKVIPNWYLSTIKYFSILWLTFIPFGTIVGYFQLKQIKRLNKGQRGTGTK